MSARSATSEPKQGITCIKEKRNRQICLMLLSSCSACGAPGLSNEGQVPLAWWTQPEPMQPAELHTDAQDICKDRRLL